MTVTFDLTTVLHLLCLYLVIGDILNFKILFIFCKSFKVAQQLLVKTHNSKLFNRTLFHVSKTSNASIFQTFISKYAFSGVCVCVCFFHSFSKFVLR